MSEVMDICRQIRALEIQRDKAIRENNDSEQYIIEDRLDILERELVEASKKSSTPASK